MGCNGGFPDIPWQRPQGKRICGRMSAIMNTGLAIITERTLENARTSYVYHAFAAVSSKNGKLRILGCLFQLMVEKQGHLVSFCTFRLKI